MAEKKVDTIVEENGMFYLLSKSTGKRLGGPYASRKQAENREKQVEYFKHLGKDQDKEEDTELNDSTSIE